MEKSADGAGVESEPEGVWKWEKDADCWEVPRINILRAVVQIFLKETVGFKPRRRRDAEARKENILEYVVAKLFSLVLTSILYLQSALVDLLDF